MNLSDPVKTLSSFRPLSILRKPPHPFEDREFGSPIAFQLGQAGAGGAGCDAAG
jgi:hypothetical protein